MSWLKATDALVKQGVRYFVACMGRVTVQVVLTLGLWHAYIDGLAQDCSKSSALAMELLQSCTKPSIYDMYIITQILAKYHTNLMLTHIVNFDPQE